MHLKKSIIKQQILREHSNESGNEDEKSFIPFSDATTHSNTSSKSSSTHSHHPTIVSLAKNYRIHYVQKINEIMGTSLYQSEKRVLESPQMARFKRRRTSSNYMNTLQTLRNRIQQEESEQFYFNDERRM